MLFYKLNLQLFADVINVTEDMGQSSPGPNVLSNEMRIYYEKRLIDFAEPNLVHDQFGDKYPIPKNGGKTIEFRKYAPLPKRLTPLVEGVTPDGQALDVSTITATVNQYGGYVKITDMLDMTAIDNNLLQATKLLGGQAGRTSDTITRDILAAGTNVMYAPKVAGGVETEVTSRADLDTTALLTRNLIFKAAAKLKSQNANPIDDAFVAIVHPNVAADLMISDQWLDVHKYAQPENIYKGEIGKLGGVRFVESTEAKIFGPSFGAGLERYTLKTALDGTGSQTIAVTEAISADEATAITAAITAGRNTIYVGGKAATLSAVTAGAAGSATFTTTANVKSVSAGAAVYGAGAASDGSSVYATLVIGAAAYGVTEVSGGGLTSIIKQLGSAGSADPLNQRATSGWKLVKTAEILVQQNMVRIEHCSAVGPTEAAN